MILQANVDEFNEVIISYLIWRLSKRTHKILIQHDMKRLLLFTTNEHALMHKLIKMFLFHSLHVFY